MDDVQSAGDHTVSWDGLDERGTRPATGVYFLQLEAGGQVQTRKIVLTR
jgi:hypothetical protein